MTAVKFCGFTREEDVRVAVRLGADYLGFNLVPASPRYVPPSVARLLAGTARQEAARVGTGAPIAVGVLATPPAEALEQARSCGLDAIQLHGLIGNEDLGAIGMPIIAAVRPRSGELPVLANGAWAYLVDAHHNILLGGTGHLADWDAAGELASRGRVFLAGGLTPANVAEAVRRVRPFAVDVASGIESAPGAKDHARMSAFMEAVRRADGRVVDSYIR